MSVPQSEDHIWAGMLNGVMVTALGAAVPLLAIWMAVFRWRDLVDRDLVQLGQGATLVLMSVAMMRFGVRMVRQHLAALKAYRPASR